MTQKGSSECHHGNNYLTCVCVYAQDEAHIFQGDFPRPDYGMGELGYKLQGLDPRAGFEHNTNSANSPAVGCDGVPLAGCLEKPVIVPVA